jgi:hypothetical protein
MMVWVLTYFIFWNGVGISSGELWLQSEAHCKKVGTVLVGKETKTWHGYFTCEQKRQNFYEFDEGSK